MPDLSFWGLICLGFPLGIGITAGYAAIRALGALILLVLEFLDVDWFL